MAKKKKADRRLTTPMKGKLILVFGGIIFLFLILVVKLCYVTATKGKEYETAVLSQQKHDSTILPFERGKIYDRNGNILATNEKIYTLILEPQNILLQDKKYEEATINALHEYFGFSKSKLKKTIEDNPYSYYEVYKKLKNELVYNVDCFINFDDEKIEVKNNSNVDFDTIRFAIVYYDENEEIVDVDYVYVFDLMKNDSESKMYYTNIENVENLSYKVYINRCTID